MSQENTIELIGDWCNTGHYKADRCKAEKPGNKYLLRACPGCGREKLRYRQKLCDDCRRKQRQKTKRESYYKSKRL